MCQTTRSQVRLVKVRIVQHYLRVFVDRDVNFTFTVVKQIVKQISKFKKEFFFVVEFLKTVNLKSSY